MSFFDRLLQALGLGARPGGRPPAGSSSFDAGMALIRERKHADRRERIAQIEALGARRQEGDLEALLAALDDPDDDVRCEALGAIRRFGAQARPALDRVLLLCSDPSKRVRERAVSMLCPGGIQPAALEAMPVLLARLGDDPEASVRREAISMIGACLGGSSGDALIGQGAAAVIKALGDPATEVRHQAAYYLGSSFKHLARGAELRGKIAAALRGALGDADAEVRMRSAVGLADFDPADLSALDELLTVLTAYPEIHGQTYAAEALAKLEGDRALARLRAELGSPDPVRRLRVNFALLHFKEGCADAVAEVERALASRALREQALELVLRFWKDNSVLKPLGPALLGLIDSASIDERRLIFQLFSRTLVNDPAAIKVAFRHAQEGDPRLRGYAIDALGNICKDAALVVPLLREALRSSSLDTRREAARVLGWFGPRGAPALPEIVGLLKADIGRASGDHLLYALRSIGAEARPAAPLLLPLLDSQHAHVRDEAATTLGQIGGGAALLEGASSERLGQWLRDGQPQTQSGLLQALLPCASEIEPLLGDLAPLLSSADAGVSRHAFELLASPAAGPAARLALLRGLRSFDESRLLRALGLLRGCKIDAAFEGDLLLASHKALSPGNAKNLLDGLEALGEAAVLALLGASLSEHEAIGLDASRRLERLAPAHVAALARALARDEGPLRLRAVLVLSQVGPGARSALEGALAHPDEVVRSQAEIALGLP